jgi:hypothetical protein
MRKVQRSEIVDYQTYEAERAESRPQAMAEKAKRRVQVGEYLTFLFESTDTIRYQVQEMMRAERIVRERDIQHEIDTYNELLGDTGELGCTLLIEIEDAAARQELLTRWLDLPTQIYVKSEDGTLHRARWDDRQASRGRLSSVQYLKFHLGQSLPVAVGCDHSDLQTETQLTPEQRAALAADLNA